MKLNIIVLAKQVPDTRNVGKDAMTPEGTVNRSALPAIFNPEDLNALEQALRIKELYPESSVKVLTMGPPRAAEIIQEGMFRGADGGWLLTDRLFAGADTLATSYALATAVKKAGKVDIIISGRQAIDGDTAQVGPQVAEKLNLPQVTYAESIEVNPNRTLTVHRHIDSGVETVQVPMPCLITVNGSAAPCRPRNAKRVMAYKHYELPKSCCWSVADINGDPAQCGLGGSPTKVKAVQNIVFQTKEVKTLSSSDEDLKSFITELKGNKVI